MSTALSKIELKQVCSSTATYWKVRMDYGLRSYYEVLCPSLGKALATVEFLVGEDEAYEAKVEQEQRALAKEGHP